MIAVNNDSRVAAVTRNSDGYPRGAIDMEGRVVLSQDRFGPGFGYAESAGVCDALSVIEVQRGKAIVIEILAVGPSMQTERNVVLHMPLAGGKFRFS